MTDELDDLDALCDCGRWIHECARDPLNPLGAIALATAMADGTALPLSLVLDDHACIVGVANSLAALVAHIAEAQPPGWLSRIARTMLTSTRHLTDPPPPAFRDER